MSRASTGPVVTLLVAAAASGAVAADPTPAERLAQQFARDINVIMEIQADQAPPTLTTLEAALVLSELAVELLPDDADLWRQRLELATAADRVDLVAEAAERIVQADPDDEVARLRRINVDIDRAQTVEDRVAAYERWLAPARRKQIGKAVASRLALDLAILLERIGDEQGFARWLSEAATLDPGHRAAAAMAAGYFIERVDDVVGQAELLVNLLLADPANAMVQSELGHLLLEHGAYDAAERLLTLATHPRPFGDGGVQVGHEIFGDLAIAQWASGHPDDALATLRSQRREVERRLDRTWRQLQADIDDMASNPQYTPEEVGERRVASREALRRRYLVLRDEAEVLFPEPGPTGSVEPSEIDRARIQGRLRPSIETVRAAILHRRDSEEARTALETASVAFTAAIEVEAQKRRSKTAPEVAALQLELALVLLWLDGPVETAEMLVQEVDAAKPLSPQAKERFAGWLALRRGSLSDAVARLSPLAPDDPAARLGLALARLELDDRRSAARDLLAVARHEPGSLMSIWAADVLFDLLGRRAASITEEAERLEELIDTLPTRLDRCLDDPTLAVGIRIAATEASFDAFAPLTVEIEVVNNWSYPLAIEPGGPIETRVAVDLSTRIAYPTGPNADFVSRWRNDRQYLLPIIVDIDRRLTLEPRQRMVVRYDLRRHRVGLLLDQVPIWGAVLRASVMLNFKATPTRPAFPATAILKPGTLGSEDRSMPFRVEGVRFERQWIREAMADVLRQEGPRDLRVLVMLSHIASAGLVGRANLPVEDQELFQQSMQSLTEAYGRLDPVAQAWVLSVIQESSADAILANAQRSEERLVKVAYLLYCLRGPDDPMLDAARRDEDPAVRMLARYANELLSNAAGPTSAGATP